VSWGDSDYNSAYFGVDNSGFNALTLAAGAPFAIGDHLTITPGVNYSMLLDSDIERSAAEDDNFWAGVSVGLAF
jgi:outer membrane scaffolding protein for murein synthesis (MipA/OmpV family)